MNHKLYFDYNATTPTDPRVVEAMLPFFTERFHNPSSFYRQAGEVHQAIVQARAHAAALINADPREIVFTSGGTESDNLAIQGVVGLQQEKRRHIVTSQIEHPAVLNTFKHLEKRGFHVTYLPVDGSGLVAPEALEKALREEPVSLVSIMHANNEIGTIQPLQRLIELTHAADALFHTDAVQSCGKIPVDVRQFGVDLLSFSSHKIYGPKGMGVLYIRNGVKVEPILHGGGHERGIRNGTENVPGIIGIGKAAELAKLEMAEEEARLRPIRDRLQQELLARIPEVLINGDTPQRLYNTLNVSIKYIEGESMLAFLDQYGLALSSGSACSSKSLDPSHVLLAIGRAHGDAHGSLRISMGKYNTMEDADKLLEVLPPIAERLRGMSPFWNKK